MGYHQRMQAEWEAEQGRNAEFTRGNGNKVWLPAKGQYGTKCPRQGCSGVGTMDDCPKCGEDLEHVRDGF